MSQSPELDRVEAAVDHVLSRLSQLGNDGVFDHDADPLERQHKLKQALEPLADRLAEARRVLAKAEGMLSFRRLVDAKLPADQRWRLQHGLAARERQHRRILGKMRRVKELYERLEGGAQLITVTDIVKWIEEASQQVGKYQSLAKELQKDASAPALVADNVLRPQPQTLPIMLAVVTLGVARLFGKHRPRE